MRVMGRLSDLEIGRKNSLLCDVKFEGRRERGERRKEGERKEREGEKVRERRERKRDTSSPFLHHQRGERERERERERVGRISIS